MSGMVLLLVATASLFSQALVLGGLAQAVTAALTQLGGRTAFLVLSAVMLLVLGFVLEGFPAILISAPLLLPIAIKVGVDPLQFGVILVMAIGIGVFAPLVGIGYYIACAVGGARPDAALRPSLFYNIFLVAGLAVVIAFPEITLLLPRLTGHH